MDPFPHYVPNQHLSVKGTQVMRKEVAGLFHVHDPKSWRKQKNCILFQDKLRPCTNELRFTVWNIFWSKKSKKESKRQKERTQKHWHLVGFFVRIAGLKCFEISFKHLFPRQRHMFLSLKEKNNLSVTESSVCVWQHISAWTNFQPALFGDAFIILSQRVNNV